MQMARVGARECIAVHWEDLMPFELHSYVTRHRARMRWLIAVLLMIAAGCAASVDDGSAVEVESEGLSLAPSLRWSVSGAGGPVAFSPDGKSLATGSAQAVVQTLSTATGVQQKTYKIRGSANAV